MYRTVCPFLSNHESLRGCSVCKTNRCVPSSRHIKSRSWRFPKILWSLENILMKINTKIVICRDCSWLKIVKIWNQFCFERSGMSNGHLFKQGIAKQLQKYSYRTQKDHMKKSWGFFFNTLYKQGFDSNNSIYPSFNGL